MRARRLWIQLLFAAWALTSAGPSHANGCDREEPVGIDLAGIEAKYASELGANDAAVMLENAKRLHGIDTYREEHQGDENQVLAALLAHRVLDGDYPATARADALILASQIRQGLRDRHLPSQYKCHELKAVDQYVAAHGEGYEFVELWASYVYTAGPFLARYLPALGKEERVRVRFEVHRSIDPCPVLEFTNGCYGPFFSKLAEEAVGTPVHRAAMEFAFEANLNLAACPQATPEERRIGEAGARRWSAELGDDAKQLLAAFDGGRFQAKELSLMCRTFGDI